MLETITMTSCKANSQDPVDIVQICIKIVVVRSTSWWYIFVGRRHRTRTTGSFVLQICLILSVIMSWLPVVAQSELDGSNRTSSHHTNNWAVIVCTSRFWFNYRHVANALSMYRSVKRLGIPDRLVRKFRGGGIFGGVRSETLLLAIRHHTAVW